MDVRRIALVGGYTAGHVLPMVAVAQSYQTRCEGAEVLFLGSRDGPEAAIAASHGFRFLPVDGAPLHGAAGRARLRAYRMAWRGFRQARRLLAGADLVAGFGSYISAGPLLAARSLGIPTAIFEANVIPGLTNRRLRRLVDLVLVATRDTTAHPGWRDAVVTGYPLRSDIVALAAERRPRRADGPVRVLITAGSRGSRFLNRRCPELVAALRRSGLDVMVHHLAGLEAAPAIEAAYLGLGVPAVVEPFVTSMASAYRWADVVICGAGAGTLAEIALLGLPALVVPTEGVADDHQAANAAASAHRAAIVCADEATWDTARLAQRVAALLEAPAPCRPPHEEPSGAATAIVDQCERLIAQATARAQDAAHGRFHRIRQLVTRSPS